MHGGTDRPAKAVTPLYCALVLEIERRRQAAGITMEMMSELMGTAERSYAKMLYPDTPSGRMASWDTMQRAIDVLFCDGFDVEIRRAPGEPLTTAGTRRKIRESAAHYDDKALREHMRAIRALVKPESISRGWKRVPKWKRRQHARKAARAKARKLQQSGLHLGVDAPGGTDAP